MAIAIAPMTRANTSASRVLTEPCGSGRPRVAHDGVDLAVDDMIDRGSRTGGQPDAQGAKDQGIQRHHAGAASSMPTTAVNTISATTFGLHSSRYSASGHASSSVRLSP